MHPRRTLAAAALTTALVAAGVGTGAGPATAGDRHGGHHPDPDPVTVTDALDGPRGVDALGRGRTIVSETDGTVSLVVERRRGPADVVPLTSIPQEFAPAVAYGRHRTVWILTGGGEPGAPLPPGAATLYRWQPGMTAPAAFADIAAYQATDPDPDDLEGIPADSNPFGLAVERDGSVLVADAAGNDVLRVSRDGSIETVARLLPRTVGAPAGLPPGSPPAGTPVPAEAVATSVAVGRDGTIYVGELRGFPATPGTSQIWAVDPDASDAVCDPDDPYEGDCTRYVDGLTSVVDLASDDRGCVYAVELSTAGWLAVETGAPGSTTGALKRACATRGHGHGGHGHGHWRRHGWREPRVEELVPGTLTLPGGVDVADGAVYVTGPVFGPGALVKVRP